MNQAIKHTIMGYSFNDNSRVGVYVRAFLAMVQRLHEHRHIDRTHFHAIYNLTDAEISDLIGLAEIEANKEYAENQT